MPPQDAGSINARMQGDFAPVHDPCIIKQGDTYYVFCTTSRGDAGGFVACRRSRDLVSWEKAGFVFAQVPEWARDAVPGTKGIWAPDISFFNGLYHLYYSVSTFGSNHSVIGLATNKTLDPADAGFEWVDRGLVVQSRKHDRFNAIDPNLFVDREGKHWLSWGSFWDGLMMARIDPAHRQAPRQGQAAAAGRTSGGARCAQPDRSALHHRAWRLLLPVRILRLLLPRREEHVFHGVRALA